MDSEDEFEKCLKKQCVDFNKENVNPTQSPFINKLTEISFDSVDFMSNEDGKNFFKKMLKVVPGAELAVPKKESL